MVAKTTYFSEPVRVSVDELMTELLRRVPERELVDIIHTACSNAEHRERHDRHMRYKCQRFFRLLTTRLSTVPTELAVTVGVRKDVQKDDAPVVIPPTSEPPVVVITPTSEPNQYEEAFDRMAEDPTPTESAAPAVRPVEKEEDDLWDHLDIPKFEDFQSVFDRYPYVQRVVRPGHGPLLVLGYASGRHRQTKNLIRRNLAVNETPFNSVVSILGLFRRKEGGVHHHIKVVKYRPGMVVRCWTNIQGEGDRSDQYRYIVCQENSIEFVSKVEYDNVRERWEQLSLLKEDPSYVVLT